MTRTVNIGTADMRTIRSAARLFHHTSAPPIIAIDPGTSSTGWCVLSPTGACSSGQGKPIDAIEAVQRVTTVACLLVVEQPAFISGQGRMWMLAWTGGELRGSLRHLPRNDSLFWSPVPQTWRMVLGVRGRPNAAATEDALLFARDKCGRPCKSIRGRDQVDEAMAVCMAAAARLLMGPYTKEPHAED